MASEGAPSRYRASMRLITGQMTWRRAIWDFPFCLESSGQQEGLQEGSKAKFPLFLVFWLVFTWFSMARCCEICAIGRNRKYNMALHRPLFQGSVKGLKDRKSFRALSCELFVRILRALFRPFKGHMAVFRQFPIWYLVRNYCCQKKCFPFVFNLILS